MNENPVHAAVSSDIARENARMIAAGSLSFACPYCGSWAPTQRAYDLGAAWGEFTCLCGKTTTRDPPPVTAPYTADDLRAICKFFPFPESMRERLKATADEIERQRGGERSA